MSLSTLGLWTASLLAQISGTAQASPQAPAPPTPLLCQPAYSRDGAIRLPLQAYVPQPGDIFLATDQAYWAQGGHWFCGSKGVHHSGIVFARPDGTMALIEAGPFNAMTIQVMDPYEHMAKHVAKGDHVWVRRRRVPLTPDQSAALTAFLYPQDGKRFAVWRMLAQVTPLRSRGPIRIYWMGKPQGPNRISYYCSELVTESLVWAGLMDAETARPSCTYPRDYFYGRSLNHYINAHLDLEPGWYPPSLWLPGVTEAAQALAAQRSATTDGVMNCGMIPAPKTENSVIRSVATEKRTR